MVVEQTFLSVHLLLSVSDCQTGMSDLLFKKTFYPKINLHSIIGTLRKIAIGKKINPFKSFLYTFFLLF
ncbi:MAG: hypothetical protein IEMM0008_1508 [bacterium]|nr:MAG: hypothetical protein IEMM0008_1508 [bacterium]